MPHLELAVHLELALQQAADEEGIALDFGELDTAVKPAALVEGLLFQIIVDKQLK